MSPSLLLVLAILTQAGDAEASQAPVRSEAPVPVPHGAMPPAPAGPVTPDPIVSGKPLTNAEIDTALSQLAARAGELAELKTLGSTRAGQPIRLLVLGTPAESTPKSAVLFSAYGAGRYDAETVLAFGELLVSERDREPCASLLADHVVLLAPNLDPDARSGEEGSAVVSFDLNFPLGWRPGSLRAGAGDYPLSEPETRIAAELVARHPNVVLAVTVSNARTVERPWAGAELPAGDRAVFSRLEEAARGGTTLATLVPWNELASPGGGFLDYVYQAHGILPVAWTTPLTSEELGGFSNEVARATAKLVDSLPQVRIVQEDLKELAAGLWQLDVAVHNDGAIPTSTVLGVERAFSGGLGLVLEGARLVATARRAGQDQPFQAGRLSQGASTPALDCGILGGGETRWLRLVVEADDGAELVLRAEGARAGTARLEVQLTGS